MSLLELRSPSITLSLLPLPSTGLTPATTCACSSPHIAYCSAPPCCSYSTTFSPSSHNLSILCTKQTLHLERLLNQSQILMSLLCNQSPKLLPVHSTILMLLDKGPLTTETTVTGTIGSMPTYNVPGTLLEARVSSAKPVDKLTKYHCPHLERH